MEHLLARWTEATVAARTYQWRFERHADAIDAWMARQLRAVADAWLRQALEQAEAARQRLPLV